MDWSEFRPTEDGWFWLFTPWIGVQAVLIRADSNNELLMSGAYDKNFPISACSERCQWAKMELPEEPT